MAPWQPQEVSEDRQSAHGLPACLLTLTVLAHPGTQRGCKSLVTKGFLATCAQVRGQLPIALVSLLMSSPGTTERHSGTSGLAPHLARPLSTGV